MSIECGCFMNLCLKTEVRKLNLRDADHNMLLKCGVRVSSSEGAQLFNHCYTVNGLIELSDILNMSGSPCLSVLRISGMLMGYASIPWIIVRTR